MELYRMCELEGGHQDKLKDWVVRGTTAKVASRQ